MSAGIQAIALSAPIIAANAIFAPRRINKGTLAMNDNPVYGLMNYDIAAGQTLKGIRAVKDLSEPIETSAKDTIKAETTAEKAATAAEKTASTAEKAAKTGKAAKTAIKILNFTADNINPLICVTSGLKVINSDDKADTLLREGLSLGLMFGAEKAAKEVIGMPYYKKNKVTGKHERVPREALYHKNPFFEKQVATFKEVCETKKLFNKVSLKPLPPIAKGLVFVGASIGGYNLGDKLGDLILGEEHKAA